MPGARQGRYQVRHGQDQVGPAEQSYARFLKAVERYGMTEPGDSVVAGVSGGPDSVALLHMLARLRRTRRFPLCVAYLHHMMRGAEADAEQAFVADLARRYKVRFCARAADVRALADARKVGVEEAGRAARYGCYAEVAKEAGANRVALGHHADDNAETVLYRILRGTGIRGLAGIPPVRPLSPHSTVSVIRPLINLTRADILRYLDRYGLPSRFDPSNASLDFARNRIRLRMLPALERNHSAEIRADLVRLAAAASTLDDWMNRRIERALSGGEAELRGGVWRFSHKWFASVPEPVAAETLREMIRRLDAPMGRLGRRHFESVLRLARAKKGSGTLLLPDGIRAEREQSRVVLRRGPARKWRPPAKPIALRVSGETSLPPYGGSVYAEIAHAGLPDLPAFLDRKGAYEEWMDYDRLKFPLAVRSWRDGDRFRPLGGRGTRKLQDFMTDQKIPRGDRRQIPIVTMSDRPVWVVGWRMDERVKVTARTKRVLRLTFESSQSAVP